MTRAKAAALTTDESAMPAKGTLLPKKAAGNTANTNVTRKRAALGDVSNVGKTEAPEGKKAGSKVGLVSKAGQPTGVQKSTARPASRTALAAKETKKATETKRAGSGAGAAATTQKRKVTTMTSQSTTVAEETEPARKKAHTVESERRRRALRAKDKENDAQPAEEEEPEAASAQEPVVDSRPDNVRDLDLEDQGDPLMVAEYADDIFAYLRKLETQNLPNPEYMDHQDDIEWKTRGILIDWLIEVHTRFHLLPETLFLATNIIDRFLSRKVVQLDRLQLVGITAMFIASKYEEVLSPHVENFKRIADNGFSEAEILSAERFVLSTLEYDLSYPNPMNFLRRVSKADNYDIQSRTVGKYLMEISLLDYRFLEFPPSMVAAAAMYLARLMLDHSEWDETLAYYAGYEEAEIQDAASLMVDYCARPVVHEAFFKKYASKKFMKGLCSSLLRLHDSLLTRLIASIIARTWAKHNAAHFGLSELHIPLDQLS